MPFARVIRREGLIQHADELTNKIGSGLVQIVQQGTEFYMDFINIKIQNSGKHNLHVYLGQKCKRVGEQYLDPYDGIEITKTFSVGGGKGYPRLKIDVGEPDGAFMGPKVTNRSHVTQKLGENKEGVHGKDPLSWKAVFFAKPCGEKPLTSEASMFCYALLKKPTNLEQYTEAGKRGKEKMAKEKKIREDAISTEKNTLSLRDVKRQCAAAFNSLGFKPSTDEIDVFQFRQCLEFLGVFLTESRIIKLFRTADLDGGGSIDCAEFEVAYHINDMLTPSHIISPVDAFETFDKEHRGEIDEIEFVELMHALQVEKDEQSLQHIFRKHDLDQSGSLDFIEFRDLWLHVCDQQHEIEIRKYVPARSSSNLPWVKQKIKMENIQTLRILLEKEEANEYDQFEGAKKIVLEIRHEARLKKTKKAAIRKEIRAKESRVARRETGKIERDLRKKEKERLQEQKKLEKIEKGLKEEHEKQKDLRAARIMKEHRAKRLQNNEREDAEREARGEHLIEFRNLELRVVPEAIYKPRKAKLILTFLQTLDLARNKLVALPETNCFFNMPSLKKLDVSYNSISSMPDELFDCTELKIMNFYHNSLSMIPEKIERLVKLQKLNVAENAIMIFPEQFCNCTTLESLICFKNQLVNLPDNFGKLVHLHTLDVSVNKLIDLPRSIGGCTSLKSLKFAWNEIEVMQPGISNLSELIYVDGSSNWLRFLPDDMMASMRSLKRLDFSCNRLTILPESIGGMETVQELDLSRNSIVNLPHGIGGMTSLETLRIHYNEIPFIPKSVGLLRRLKTLILRKNKLVHLPAEVGGLTALKEIDCSWNAMEGEWPQEIGCLNKLETATFAYNKITSLPYSVGGMTSLKTLSLSNNLITKVAETVGNMLSLEKLDFSCNKLLQFPHRVCDAQSLTHLDLSGNCLTSLPRELAKLRSLKFLSVYNNRLKALPSEYGPLIRELDSFYCGRNPFETLKPKWSNNWTPKDTYSTAFQNGYTCGEIQDKVMEAHLWYPDAFEVWHKLGFADNWQKAKLSRFITTCRARMMGNWRARFELPIEQFFFKCKHNNGHAVRYDQLSEQEISDREENKKIAKQWHADSVVRIREAMYEYANRAASSYQFDEYEVKRRFKNYKKDKEARDLSQKNEEVKQLRAVCKFLEQKQDQRARDRATVEAMEKRREMAMLKTITAKRVIQKNYGDVIEKRELQSGVDEDPYAVEIIPRAMTS
jgi:Leucine-rich repeat (LRR) protein/Ca2+-binding EF-hand superfamily protein|eukprot:g3629.t1